MDNASKALIMAGAILIAVMLISLGVLLYNRAQGIAEDAMGSVDSLGNEAYNAQFTPYVGNDMKASSVKQLINKVKSAKAAGVEIDFSSDSGITDVSQVSNNKTYTVTTNAPAGIITSVKITENGSSGS